MNQSYMKEKPILPLLLSLSLPMMLSMLVSSLYNIVDSIFVARISEEAMTALSLVYPVQNLITAIAVGYGIAMNAVIAHSLGANARKTADIAATQGTMFNIIHGIVVNILGLLLMPSFLRLFTSDPDVIRLGLQYTTITLSFSVIIMTSISFEKLFQAVGMMLISMAGMMAGCIVNIVLDPVLIFGYGPFPAMGIQGAAWATGIGQLVTLLLYLIAYVAKEMPVNLRLHHIKPQALICRRLYAIGIPSALSMALPSFLVSALNGILAGFSGNYVVVLGIYYKLQTFLYLPANGIIQGMRPLLSYNQGAAKQQRVRTIYRITCVLIAGIMGIGMIICQIIPAQLAGLFTNNSETITASAVALRMISMGFLASSLSVTSAGALEALGKGTMSFLISLLRYVVIIIPGAYLLSRQIGVTGVWHAFWIAESLTALAAFFIYRKTGRQTV